MTVDPRVTASLVPSPTVIVEATPFMIAEPPQQRNTGGRWRRLLLWVAIAIAAGGVGWWWLGQEQSTSNVTAMASAVSEKAPLPVTVSPVEPVRGYQVKRTYTGEIVPRKQSDLGFEQGGTLAELLVDKGAEVMEGQPLARLDTRTLKAQKAELEAQRLELQAGLAELNNGSRWEDIAAGQGAVAELEEQLTLASLKTQRREQLYAEGAISLEQLDEERVAEASLKRRLEIAQSNLDKLNNGSRPEPIAGQQARIQGLDAQIRQIEIQISKAQLLAPFSGTIGDRLVDPGMVVGAGSPVFRLVAAGMPEAHIGIPPNLSGQMRAGQTYSVNVRGQGYSGTVTALLPALNSSTRTTTAILQLNDAPTRLRAGETAQLDVTETQPLEGFWVTSTALVPGEQGLWSVYVLGAKQPQPHQYIVSRQDVEVLHTQGDRSLVRGLLQPGDRLISSGSHRLVTGQTVTVQ
ncbi:efflux RND transporter periplasmic adaptor subunit [Synechocystis sp. FACHB-383]|uniref:efflux RND transporter periplasmic adaptor subunit n=1 Tax=Synechocystis sp. FACHB-383 TaxID=2692864 RepID=UPI001685B245|nr:efflux RND transporter periplasmic adaptor subunit [Synechocystis sp. FACHB-383]MBD2655452.1 efflux RND transporter periplasmic adaptor subunit [Synechocystis sp. FACHB-383]